MNNNKVYKGMEVINSMMMIIILLVPVVLSSQMIDYIFLYLSVHIEPLSIPTLPDAGINKNPRKSSFLHNYS